MASADTDLIALLNGPRSRALFRREEEDDDNLLDSDGKVNKQ